LLALPGFAAADPSAVVRLTQDAKRVVLPGCGDTARLRKLSLRKFEPGMGSTRSVTDPIGAGRE
jgi:hypothetical protein